MAKNSKGKKQAVPEVPFARLCLVTPARFDLDAFAIDLDAALRSGDVATLLIAFDEPDPGRRFAVAEKLVPIAQANGAAAILVDDGDLVVPTGADGLHIDLGVHELRQAVERLHPDRIVGGGGIHSRHDAMLAAETDCDYLFFGRFDGDTSDAIFDKTLDLAAWWSAVFEVPAIVMGGRSIDSVAEAVEARVEFVALRSAIWEHPEGAAAAVAAAHGLILARQPEAAS